MVKWTTKVDGKNVQHRLIRRVRMDQFYAILTDDENVFYKTCRMLPNVINAVVYEEDGVKVPSDTVVQELKNVASLYAEYPEGLAMAMAVYMLGFSTYKGFGQGTGQKIGFGGEPILKRVYEYAQRMDQQ